MVEDALIGLCFLTTLGAIGFAIFAWFWMRKLGQVEDRLERTRRELRDVRADLERLASAAGKVAEVARPHDVAAAVEHDRVREVEVAPVVAAPAPAPNPLPIPSPSTRREPSIAAAAPSPVAPPIVAAPRSNFELERWIGVRGAAVAGGIALALAAILFFRHAIVHGWISPSVRVAFGVAFGIAALAFATPLRRRGFGFAPAALEGGGLVSLYASIWAANQLYSMINGAVAFAAMIVVTAIGCALSLRQRSQLVLGLALGGGFATPLLLSSGEDHPYVLFGYLLFLNAGLFAVVRRTGWRWVSSVAIAFTTLYEIAWIFAHGASEHELLGLSILGVFGLFFAFATRGDPDHPRAVPLFALLFPLAFGVEFALQGAPGGDVTALAAMLGVLGAAASFVARRERHSWLAHAAVSASVASLATWMIRAEPFDAIRSRELGVAVAVLALVQHVFFELDRRSSAQPMRDDHAATFAAVAFGLVAAFAALHETRIGIASVLGSLVVPIALLVRQSFFARRGDALRLGGAVCGIGVASYGIQHVHIESALSFVWLASAIGAVWCAIAASSRRAAPRTVAWAPAAFALPVLFAAVAANSASLDTSSAVLGANWSVGERSAWLLVGELALGLCAFASSAWMRSGFGYLLGVVALLAANTVWVNGADVYGRAPSLAAPITALALSAAAAATFALFVVERFNASRLAWRAASIAPLFWSILVLNFGRLVPGRSFGVLDFASFAAFAALIAWLLEFRWPPAERSRADVSSVHSTARMWFSSCAALLATLSILDACESGDRWIGLVILSGALAVATARFARAGAFAFAAGVGGFGLIALAIHAANGEYQQSDALLVNRVSSFNLGAAACYFAAAWSLARRKELTAIAPWSRALVGFFWLCGLVAIFLWLNLEILNAFTNQTMDVSRDASTGQPMLEIRFEHAPPRDLATSIAWAVYALVLLAIGMLRRARALRWTSLVLLVATIAKVFLYDLGELEGLYRVGSLLGLAFSLIAVSLAYQKFVFGRESERDASPTPASAPRE